MEKMSEVLARWNKALDIFQEEFGEDDLTYRAVLQEESLFGNRPGGIEVDEEAKRILVSALNSKRAMTTEVASFVTLALCDLAVTVVDDSAYDGFTVKLGQSPNYFQMNSTPRIKLQMAIRLQTYFPIRIAEDGRNLYILSLCHFVPAYRMRLEVLHRLVLRLLDRFSGKWQLEDGGFDSRRFRDEVAEELSRQYIQRAGDRLEAIVALLLQIRSVIRYAASMDDFATVTSSDFVSDYTAAHGIPPMSGQPLSMDVIWEDIRALLLVDGSTVRTSPRGLRGWLKREKVGNMPDGTDLPEDLLDWAEQELPWGEYLLKDGRTLLVSGESNLSRLNASDLNRLLVSGNAEEGEVRLIKVRSVPWLAASWPFRVENGPASSPLWGLVDAVSQRVHVVQVASRPEYSVHPLDGDSSRLPVCLTGDGRKAVPTPQVLWRIVETAQGPRMRAVLMIPVGPESRGDSVSVTREGKSVGDYFAWGTIFTDPLEVSPSGDATVTWLRSGKGQGVPFSWSPDRPVLFTPAESPGTWKPALSAEEALIFRREAFLVGRADMQWQCRGVGISPIPGGLGDGWESVGLWKVTREGRSRSVAIGTVARNYWETERRAFLELSINGGTRMEDGSIRYDDARQISISVNGYLGKHKGNTEAGECHLRLREGSRQNDVPLNPEYADVAWNRSGEDLLREFGKKGSLLRRWSISLDTPSAVRRVDPCHFELLEEPCIEIRAAGRVLPGDTSLQLVMNEPEGLRANLERGDPSTGVWLPVEFSEGSALFSQDLSREALETGVVTIPLKIDGRTLSKPCRVEFTAVRLRMISGRTVIPLLAGTSVPVLDWSEDGQLEVTSLVAGERVEFRESGEESPFICSLTSEVPSVPLGSLDIRKAETRCEVFISPRGGVSSRRLGEIRIRRFPVIRSVSAKTDGAVIRVEVEGFIPENSFVRAVLVDADGDEFEETSITPSSGLSSVSEATLNLPPHGITDGWLVWVETQDGSEYKTAIEENRVSESPGELDIFISLVRSGTGEGTLLPDVGSLGAHARMFAETLLETGKNDCIDSRDAYLRLLLAPPPDSSWLPVVWREMLRLITSMNKEGSLDWWESSENERRLVDLVTGLEKASGEDRALNRCRFLACLAACRLDPEGKEGKGLRQIGIQGLFRPKSLAEYDETEGDDILESFDASFLLERLIGFVEDAEQGVWADLARFLAHIDPDYTGLALVEELREKFASCPESKPLSRLVLLLEAMCMHGKENAFSSPEIFLAGASVKRGTDTDRTFWNIRAPGAKMQLDRIEAELYEGWGRDACVEIVCAGASEIIFSRVSDVLREVGPEKRRSILSGVLRSKTFHLSLLNPSRDIAQSLFQLFEKKEEKGDASRWFHFLCECAGDPRLWTVLTRILEKPAIWQEEKGNPEFLRKGVGLLLASLERDGGNNLASGRALAASAAVVLGAMVPVGSAAGGGLSDGYEFLASSIVELLSDPRKYGTPEYWRCMDFYRFKQLEAKDDQNEVRACIRVLALLVGAMESRSEDEDREARQRTFDRSGDLIKLLAKCWYTLARVSRKDEDAVNACRTYLRYLSCGRWDRKERDVWKKIRDCLKLAESQSQAALRLECALSRMNEGLWRSAAWWLAEACQLPEGIVNGTPEKLSEAVGDYLAGKKGEVARTARKVLSMVVSAMREEDVMETEARTRACVHRKISVLFSAAMPASSWEDQYPEVSDLLEAARKAVSHALQGQDEAERFSELLMQPGVPPKTHRKEEAGDFIGLLLDGTRGEPRQRIMAWVAEGNPLILKELESYQRELSEDLRVELA